MSVPRPAPSTIPDEPGAYLFRDGDGRVIYVGKARSLRKRLASYWGKPLHARTEAMTAHLLAGEEPEPRPSVTLVDYDPDGEDKVLAAILSAASDLPEDQLAARVRTLAPEERFALLDAYVGERANRRHKPGRAFERTGYRFDVLADYGAFRDLQRHRMLTIEWQPLSTRHGYEVPAPVVPGAKAVDVGTIAGDP